jgi:hypothetical protein
MATAGHDASDPPRSVLVIARPKKHGPARRPGMPTHHTFGRTRGGHHAQITPRIAQRLRAANRLDFFPRMWSKRPLMRPKLQ